ncbi:MAG: FAD-dependent monooxygenase [Methylophilaceae bacterium]
MSAERILIIGGGPVGATLALLLAQQGIASQVFEARAAEVSHNDTRALALSFGSRRIFERIGAWDKIAPHTTPIKTIHVSQKGSIGRSKLQAHEHGLEALGYVVSYGALITALAAAISADRLIQIQYAAVAQAIHVDATQVLVDIAYQQQVKQMASRLAVIADGGRSANSLIELERVTKPYGHDALVTKVAAELAHNNVAYERFTTQGPIALLPNGERDFSLVWTGKQEKIAPLLHLSEQDFLTALHRHFGDRVGQFTRVEKRLTFPLVMAKLEAKVTPHLAVIGNAAQTMHPVAGQGFNVGLRDANTLAKQLASSAPTDWGGETMLAAYQASRQRDTRSGLMFTDFLVHSFSMDLIGLSALRSAGLGWLDMVRPAKSVLIKKMSFGS